MPTIHQATGRCRICDKPAEVSVTKGILNTCRDPLCKLAFRRISNKESQRLKRERLTGTHTQRVRRSRAKHKVGWKEVAYQISEEERELDFQTRQAIWPLTRDYIPGGMTKEENEIANLMLWADELRLWG